jgi:hypothetical protein
VTGLGLGGRHVWLDDQGELFALAGFIRKGHESALPTVQSAQRRAVRDREVAFERTLVRPAQGRLALYDANVFDANTGSVRSGLTVVISGNRIESVEPTRPEDRSVPGAIDAAGTPCSRDSGTTTATTRDGRTLPRA